MFRWDNVEEKTLYGMTVKMYRQPFMAKEVFASPFKDLEFDHYSYRYFDSELFMYRMLDTNFERFLEERGDVYRMGTVNIPTIQDTNKDFL